MKCGRGEMSQPTGSKKKKTEKLFHEILCSSHEQFELGLQINVLFKRASTELDPFSF